MLIMLHLNQTNMAFFFFLPSYSTSSVQICTILGGLPPVMTHPLQLASQVLFPESKINVSTNKQPVPSGVLVIFNTPASGTDKPPGSQDRCFKERKKWEKSPDPAKCVEHQCQEDIIRIIVVIKTKIEASTEKQLWIYCMSTLSLFSTVNNCLTVK